MDFIFILWIIAVIVCLNIEFNPKIRDKIIDYIVIEQIYYNFYNNNED